MICRTWGPSVGSVGQMLLLLVILIIFQIFKPTSMKSKGKLFLKLIGCVTILLFCLVFAINMNEDPEAESKSFFPLVAAYVAFQIVIGYILPGVFVSSYDSLKEYFGKLMTSVIRASKSFGAGLKMMLLKQNRVDSLDLQEP